MDADAIESSLCRKLYEAARNRRGLHLTADEVFLLVIMDDAVNTRISNEACRQVGVDPCGHGAISTVAAPPWGAFCKQFKETP